MHKLKPKGQREVRLVQVMVVGLGVGVGKTVLAQGNSLAKVGDGRQHATSEQ